METLYSDSSAENIMDTLKRLTPGPFVILKKVRIRRIAAGGMKETTTAFIFSR
ncbi:MAG: hypothetical protein BWY84_00988 [Candidatus Aerophobetes bacterium ADurb.Bin490]|nr:MAG: hypothetical protein BWY84_00988 [Candidatus Aerophobetes bacterium ADurb.Bin490]